MRNVSGGNYVLIGCQFQCSTGEDSYSEPYTVDNCTDIGAMSTMCQTNGWYYANCRCYSQPIN